MSPLDPFVPVTRAEARARGYGRYGRPTYNQATKIVRKFGGEEMLAQALGIHRVTPFRWQYSRPVGTDGLIPTEMVSRIHEVARLQGVLLTPEDWVAERVIYDTPAAPGVPAADPATYEVVKAPAAPEAPELDDEPIPGAPDIPDPSEVAARLNQELFR